MSCTLSAVYQSMASGRYYLLYQSKDCLLHLRGIFIELLLQWQYSSFLILASAFFSSIFCQENSSPRQSRGRRVRGGLWDGDGERRHKSIRAVLLSAFCAVCVILSVSTSSASVPAAFPFTSLSPLLHRRSLCEGTRFGRYVCTGRRRLFVCLRMHSFLIGLFHDVFIFNIFIFNIDGSDALLYICI